MIKATKTPHKCLNTDYIFGIFAHPDDEAFGPCATLIEFVQAGKNVNILCATKGENGENHFDKNIAIDRIRQEEVKKSSQIIGAQNIEILNFLDGTLSNNLYHKIAKALQDKIQKLAPNKEYSIMTFDLDGVSGHLDHIAMSFISTYIFHHDENCKSIWYYSKRAKNTTRKSTDYFVYYPKGRADSEISLSHDITALSSKKLLAINCHLSQIEDIKKILSKSTHLMIEENFVILNK